MEYKPFDLAIRPSSSDDFEVEVLASPAGNARGTFSLPFSEDELKAFMRSLPDARYAGAPEDETDSPMDVKEFGSRLYQAVFNGQVGASLIRSLDKVEGDKIGLRILLRIDDRLPQISSLPWEYLYIPDRKRHPALARSTPIVRYLPIPLDRPLTPVPPPLVVVAVVSNPRGVRKLAVEKEFDHLQEAVNELGSDQIRLEPPLATWEALQARLRQKPPVHIVHFIGHGYFDAKEGAGGLIFEKADKTANWVPAEKFMYLLNDKADLRLVFLNACRGAASGRSEPFAGTAQRLVQQGIPAVLAMQFPVTDPAAIAFSRTFYRELTQESSLEAAVSEARLALVGLNTRYPEWGTPVLFSRSDDNILIDQAKQRLAAIEARYRARVIEYYNRLGFAGLGVGDLRLADVALDDIFVRLKLTVEKIVREPIPGDEQRERTVIVQ